MKSITLPDGWLTLLDEVTGYGPNSTPGTFQVNDRGGQSHTVALAFNGGNAASAVAAMTQLFTRTKSVSGDGVNLSVPAISSFNGGNPIPSQPATVNMLSALSYDGGGNAGPVTTITGAGYVWTPGANDLTLVNGTAVYNASAGQQTFTAQGTSITLTGTVSVSVSGTLSPNSVQIIGSGYMLPQWPAGVKVYIMGCGMPYTTGAVCAVIAGPTMVITADSGGTLVAEQIITIALPDTSRVPNVGDPLDVRDASGDDWFDVAVVDPNTNVASVLSNAAQWSS